ncbi:hypothetical protein BV20DRAFT_975133 [Pilatotrama ljubarskyi]|nr:hypothetical protein BV20DRAFT_975133 [Pilatotrama ljubarskyi]
MAKARVRMCNGECNATEIWSKTSTEPKEHVPESKQLRRPRDSTRLRAVPAQRRGVPVHRLAPRLPTLSSRSCRLMFVPRPWNLSPLRCYQPLQDSVC